MFLLNYFNLKSQFQIAIKKMSFKCFFKCNECAQPKHKQSFVWTMFWYCKIPNREYWIILIIMWLFHHHSDDLDSASVAILGMTVESNTREAVAVTSTSTQFILDQRIFICQPYVYYINKNVHKNSKINFKGNSSTLTQQDQY